MSTKAVRFSELEEQLVTEFLIKNPYFDFSTLARMAILHFVQNPDIKFQSIELPTVKQTVSKKRGGQKWTKTN